MHFRGSSADAPLRAHRRPRRSAAKRARTAAVARGECVVGGREGRRVRPRRFRSATVPDSHLTRPIANSAGALRYPSARFDAARCGVALYGLSPFGTDPSEDGLEPVLSWTSHIAQARLLRAGESTGYGRRFIAEKDTWIGIVPVGYADGFRRNLTG